MLLKDLLEIVLLPPDVNGFPKVSLGITKEEQAMHGAVNVSFIPVRPDKMDIVFNVPAINADKLGFPGGFLDLLEVISGFLGKGRDINGVVVVLLEDTGDELGEDFSNIGGINVVVRWCLLLHNNAS